MALQAGVLPSRQEQGRAGNKQSWKELVMTAAATRNVKLQAQQRYFHLLIFILMK